MFKAEDVTNPESLKPKKHKRIIQIEATEEDFDRICDMFLAADPMTDSSEDESFFEGFVHAIRSACCW